MKRLLLGVVFLFFLALNLKAGDELQRMKYNNPGLVVDLGVGLWAWPLPMDYDGDGDNDLLVSCPDKPFNGIYFFENPDGDVDSPVFKPGVKLAASFRNIQPSYVGDSVRILIPGYELVNYKKSAFEQKRQIFPKENINPNRVRANQWRYLDYEGDGDLDLIVGVGDWTEYGWDNAFNEKGEWTRGPLHGYVYLLENCGSNYSPDYLEPVKIQAGGRPVDVYGMPSPNFADFDNDGDLDLLCGEFLDKLTYFENSGTRSRPRYEAGRYLSQSGEPIKMDLEMILPIAIDWDKDGDIDLVVGQEDGRVALLQNTGVVKDGMPQFKEPVFFKQQADEVKFGALVTPWSFDWDGDGDEDLICGNTAGYIGFIENLDGGNPPKWATPQYLRADGEIIRIQAGSNGSIQGPCEAKWGYTTLSVADWDQDDLPDIVVNSIWGKVIWFKNVGSRRHPRLAKAQPIEVMWQGNPPKPAWFWWNPGNNELATQWRTTPVVYDWNGDGLNDLVMLDHEGYLALFQRQRVGERLELLPPKRIFYGEGPSEFDSKHRVVGEAPGLLRLNARQAGSSGRRKFCFADWNLDGKPDLIVNSESVNLLENVSENGKWQFRDAGKMTEMVLAGHTTSPTTVDWDKNGIPDLLIGAEDGYFYYLKNQSTK